MKYIYRIVFVVVFLFTVYYQFYDRLPSFFKVKTASVPTPVPSITASLTPAPIILADEEIIKNMTTAFAKKYNRPATDFSLTVSDKDATHAKGSVQIKGEMGGGLWLGALSGSNWILAFDGNGIVDCSSINPYNFSKTMVPQCLDVANGNNLIQR